MSFEYTVIAFGFYDGVSYEPGTKRDKLIVETKFKKEPKWLKFKGKVTEEQIKKVRAKQKPTDLSEQRKELDAANFIDPHSTVEVL